MDSRKLKSRNKLSAQCLGLIPRVQLPDILFVDGSFISLLHKGSHPVEVDRYTEEKIVGEKVFSINKSGNMLHII